MARHTSEMRLIITASNAASGSLRRVGNDLRALGRHRGLQIQQQKVLLAQQGQLRQAVRTRNELQSIQQGSRRTAMEIRGIQNKINAQRLLAAGLGAASLQGQKLALQNQKLTHSHSEASARAKILHSDLARISQRYAILTQQQKSLGREIRRVRWEPLSIAGRTIQHLGRVGAYATAILGAGLLYAANSASQFNKQAQLVGTQMGRIGISAEASTKLGNQLGNSLIKLLPKSTSSMEELNAAAYDLFSSLDSAGKEFLTLADGNKLLALTSKAAIAGQTDIATATDGLIGVIQNFKLGIEETEPALQRMFAAVRFGRMTFGEFAKTLSVTAPAANQAGQSLDTLAGTMAFLTRRLDVNKASIGFARLLEIFTRKKFTDGFKDVGISLTGANGKFVQLDEMMRRIVKRFPEVTKKGTKELAGFFKMIGNQEGTIMARRAFQALATDMEEYQSVLSRVKRDNKEFTKSLKAMEATTGVRWEKFTNQLRALALMIGSAVLPEILKLAPHISRMVDWFNDLDPALRNNIVHFTAIGVAILGVASAAAFLLGPLIRVVAILLKGRALFLVLGVGFVAASVAIAMLTGKWEGLNTIINNFFSLTTHGTWGWVAMFAIAAAGAYKLAKAITAVRNAYIMASAASAGGSAIAGAGGLVGLFGRAGSAGKTLKAIPAATAGVGKLRAALFLAGTAAAAIPVAGWAIAGALVAAGGAALLWKRHMDAIARRAQEIKNLDLQAKAPGLAAQRFGGTPDAIRSFKQSQIDVRGYNLELQSLKASLKGLTGVERARALLNIAQTELNRSNALKSLNTAYQNLRVSAGAFTDYLAREQIAQARIGEQQLKVNRLLQDRAALLRVGYRMDDPGIQKITNQITDARTKIAQWARDLISANQLMRSGFNKTITVLQQLRLLPAKISPQMKQMAFDFQRQLGRLMSPGELTRFFKFALNLDTAPANNKMVQFIRMWEAKRIKLSADVKIAAGQRGKLTTAEILSQGKGPLKRGAIEIPARLGKIAPLPPGFMGGLKIPPIIPKGKPGPARKTIKNAFKDPIKQKIDVDIPDSGKLSALGAAITRGIQSGMTDATQTVRIRKITDTIINTFENSFKNSAEIASPSARFARTVGRPIVSGILMGMLDKKADIQKTAALVMDLFNGAFLQAKQQKIDLLGDNKEFSQLKLDEYLQRQKDFIAKYKKNHREIDKINAAKYGEKAKLMQGRRGLNAKDLIADMRGQVKAMVEFNQAIAKIKARKPPVEMLEYLRSLGVDGLKYIKIIANASPAEFRRIVRNWNQMQGQIRKSQHTTIDDLKAWKKATLEQLKEFKDTAAQKLLDTWNELKEINKTNFGALFDGLDAKVGSGFTDALDEWKNQVKDFQEQIKDLNQEIMDAHKEAADRLADAIAERREQLQQAMGTLFAGDWMESAEVANKVEWSVVLGFDDLFKDLEGQVNKFNDWRSTLTSLAAKVPPDLAKALEDLGPEALDKLHTLNNATDQQLADYVALWLRGQDAIKNLANKTTVDTADITQRIGELVEKIGTLTDALAALVEPKPLSAQDVLDSISSQSGAFETFMNTLENLRDKGLPNELVLQLAQMGPDALPYMQALNNMTGTQLNQFIGLWTTAQGRINTATNQLMNVQLEMWYSHGANIAAAMIAGVSSEQYALLKFFENMFSNMLTGNFPQMPGVPTSTVNMQQVADSLEANPDATFGPSPYVDYPTQDWASDQVSTGNPRNFRQNSTPVGAQTTVYMEVNAVQDESLDTTLDRAAFRMKNSFD